MKPNDIHKKLDKAYKISQIKGRRGEIVPLFVSHSGIGKSQIVQQWAKNNGMVFKDLRVSYFDNPDFIGMFEVENGRTTHRTPDFWPGEEQEGKPGILCLEELNTGSVGIQGALLQLLTERTIHKHKIPDNWIICGCVNPNTTDYNVVPIGAALMSRFSEYFVEFDMTDFVKYCTEMDFHPAVLSFISSGLWLYKTPEQITNAKDKYICPRTWEKINLIFEIEGTDGYGFNADLHSDIYAHLGTSVGQDFIKYVNDLNPVLIKHLKDDWSKAIHKLKGMTVGNYKGEMVNVTIRDMLDQYRDKHIDLDFIDKVWSEGCLPRDMFKSFLPKLASIHSVIADIPLSKSKELIQSLISSLHRTKSRWDELKDV
jgi:hypothetical protein